MAGENYTKWTISDVSWRDMLAQDPYYWLSNSFQYSENINCDDELHGIKLSQKIQEIDDCANCQLISAGDRVFALPLSWWAVKTITYTKTQGSETGTWSVDSVAWVHIHSSAKPQGVIFQDSLWIMIYADSLDFTGLYKKSITGAGNLEGYVPYDHVDDTDDSIASESTTNGTMKAGAWVIINYNNTRLVVGAMDELRVYYPELDATNQNSPYYDANATPGKTGWKKVQTFEAGSVIVWLTCTFEYLKVWVQDEGWNTKVFFYQWNNDLRNTFVYDLIDLTGTKVLRVYNINGIDYYTASLDWTDWYITLNKIIGDTPVQIFKQRAGLTRYDINQKAWYFVGPTSIDAWYLDGNFYIADAYGVFKFAYNPTGYDTGYLKRKIRNTREITPGLCVYKNFVLVSDQEWVKMMRTYDTGVDGYERRGILISREMEWDYGGCVAKIIDELRCHFELNNLKDENGNYLINAGDLGTIDIYLSPNNTWQHSDPDIDPTGWWHVMTLDGTSRETRYESIQKLSQLPIGEDEDWNPIYWNPVFEYDRETITYCVVIKRWKADAQWTPIVREVLLNYHIKWKTNKIYRIK